MKKIVLILLTAIFVTACNTVHDQALKSADKDFILKVANEHFANKKWAKSLALYERLSNLVAGTDDAPNVVFNSAYANYYDKNYKLAGHQFKNFAVTFPQDPRKEEAAYMSALCYYEGSMDYNLDQTSTELAINELQNFLNEYPNSERSRNISELTDELSYKLEYKAYENARQYFKMGEYKAADVAFENVLEDFPSTKLRPSIYDYILKSRFELAVNSVFSLKQERIERAMAFTRLVEKEMPGTENAKTAQALRSRLVKEQENFARQQKEFEAQKAALVARQQRESERTATDAEKQTKQALRDSAKLSTPPPAVTLPLEK
ncbi:outer membrane protein assembly factor BamD [Kaistella sp. PBT33-4]|uniref:outer membrane protein assembly factor BamD n=1 Tax=Kaistella sp. PBT33-4 TaxID=3032000 RepID=UPI0023D831F0|nr:outer membrane protein assembly factor BamD [Kaistella sp. PBT33-4]MDF0719013.1 outer membrane protein assembly factor BamD [Kaistella sp. PBT33-4]